MIVYNVTAKVTWAINDAFVDWMKQVHIPEVLGTGLFFEYRMLRLLETDETEGPTYAIQYTARTPEDYNRYISEYAPQLRQKVLDKWGDQYLAFRSVLQVVN